NGGRAQRPELNPPQQAGAGNGQGTVPEPPRLHGGGPPRRHRGKELIQRPPEPAGPKVVHPGSGPRPGGCPRASPPARGPAQKLTDLGAKVDLIDVASRNRKPDRKNPAYSDNVAILELKPRNRVAAVDKEVEIEVRVKNYGSTNLSNVLVEFHLNGQPNVITS